MRNEPSLLHPLSLHISCRGQDRGGVKFVVLFPPLPNFTKLLLGTKGYLYPPFTLKFSLKNMLNFYKNASICSFFLIAQSVLNAQNFHCFPTRLCWKAKNSKQAS